MLTRKRGILWGAIVVVVAAAPAGVGQESQAVLRLQQEVSNLRFQLDYQTQQFEQRLLILERDLGQRRGRAPELSGAAPPVPRVAPVLPSTAADEVLTRRVVVTDAEGRVRAVLAVSETVGPVLSLLDENGRVTGSFSTGADGPRIELFDDLDRRRVLIGLRAGEPVIERFGEQGAGLPR